MAKSVGLSSQNNWDTSSMQNKQGFENSSIVRELSTLFYNIKLQMSRTSIYSCLLLKNKSIPPSTHRCKVNPTNFVYTSGLCFKENEFWQNLYYVFMHWEYFHDHKIYHAIFISKLFLKMLTYARTFCRFLWKKK